MTTSFSPAVPQTVFIYRKGETGKSAYQLYLDTTDDTEPLDESTWSAGRYPDAEEKITGVHSGFFGQESIHNHVLYKCVVGGVAGVAIWNKVVLSSTNKAPTDIILSNSDIDENNIIGEVVGILSSVDVWAGDTFTYTLVSGTGDTDNAAFTIDGNELLADEVFNFEEQDEYSIRIRTTDSEGLYFEKEFTILINDLDESSAV
jgi:hypothetical protein